MKQTDKLLKELVVQMKIFNSNFQNYADSKTAIKLLGRSNPREMKYFREHFLKPQDYKMKNACTYEYQVKALMELKGKIDSGLVQVPSGQKKAA